MRGQLLSNAFHFIKCSHCGYEFQSAFSGSAAAIGCSECCPNCNNRVVTPNLFGDMSLEPFQEISGNTSPIHNFKNGYVFNGHISAMWEFAESDISPVVAMFYRNFSALIISIETIDNGPRIPNSTELNQLIVLSMTALEKLVRDIYDVLFDRLSCTGQKISLSRISRWEHAFRSRFGDSIGNLFSGGHFAALGYLSTFRNCITHQAGIVDQQTIIQMGAHPRIHLYREGGPLPMDLETVIALSDSVSQFGYALIQETARTLNAHRASQNLSS